MNRVCVIVISYNRPKMLIEALRSIRDADQIIIADDGSDFDPEDIVAELRLDASVIRNSQITRQERVYTQRLGSLVNKAIGISDCERITYLCDDDVFAPNWLMTAKNFMKEYPKYHLIRGIIGGFVDGQDPYENPFISFNSDPRQMVTGNFIHKKECSVEEGVWWPTDRLLNHDDGFLINMNEVHDTFLVPSLPVFSVMRRQHDGNLSNYFKRDGDGKVVHEFSEEQRDIILNNKL